PGTLRDREDRRAPPQQRLPEARHPLAVPAAGSHRRVARGRPERGTCAPTKTVGETHGVPLLSPVGGPRTMSAKPKTAVKRRREGRLVMAGVLYGLAQFCARRRFVVLAAWLLVTVALVAVSHRLGDNTND